MPLEAILTVGWPHAEDGEPTAQALHDAATAQNGAYTEALRSALSDLHSAAANTPALTIKATDALFRRRTGAFGGIKQFVGALNEIQAGHPELGTVQCEMDTFAYAFLKSAKNFDFVLPEVSGKTGPFRTIFSGFTSSGCLFVL